MPPEVTIRPLQPDDRLAVIGLLDQLNRFENALVHDRTIDGKSAADCLAADEGLVESKGGALLVGCQDERIVAFMALVLGEGAPFIVPRFRKNVCVVDLVVAEGFRGRGIGKAMLARADDLARAHECHTIVLSVVVGNEAAIETYRKAGFAPAATEMVKRIN